MATLSADEAHHVTRVLRLDVGDELIVFDGRGREWLGRIASATRRGVTVALEVERTAAAEPPVAVTLAIGLLKGDRMDAVVRDATMMGVAVMAPFVSAHVALSSGARRARSVERWERIAVASAKQCGRTTVPEIRSPAGLEETLADRTVDLKLACVEPAHRGVRPYDGRVRPRRALLLIGPEGGWSPREIEVARTAGAEFMSLGPRIIRADAAPTVALSVLWTTWGWQ
jgi:16S rRNA (uracil1498-N3)-methyltransferase